MFDDYLVLEVYPTVLDHGTPVEDRSQDPTKVYITGCDAQPGAPQEVTLPRADLDRVAWTVYCPPGTLINDDQTVRVNDGPPCRQVGMPQAWGSGAGALDHTVIYLERWVG